MRPAELNLNFWWLFILALVLLYFTHLLWMRIRSKPHHVAYISFVLGLVGMLLWPLGPVAIYCGLRAKRLGFELTGYALWMARSAIALGIIATIVLVLAFPVAVIYLYGWISAWITGDNPFR